MIDFRCRCSHAFSVADDRAGESFQCPSCGLLVDVPTLEELDAMQEDGSYTLTDTAGPTARMRPVSDTPSVVARHDQKDRRLSLKEFLAIGTTDDDLLEIKDEVKPGVPKHPKYDPDTGELIVPLAVKAPPAKAEPLMAQPVVLSYEVEKRNRAPTIWMPFVEMFHLPNLVVCGIMTLIYGFALFVGGAVNIFLVIIGVPVLMLTISHFANVIDETGPSANDEMPRPLRGVNLYEDMIRPLAQVFFAYALAYSPILLFNLYVQRLPALANLGLMVLFFVLVPALLITIITSGALNNLVPSRMLSVIGASSWHYWVVAVFGYVATLAFLYASAWMLSAGDTALALLSSGAASSLMRKTMLGLPHRAEVVFAPVVLFVGMYLMHIFTWQMGLLYRLHHERFTWVLQKHDKTARDDTLSQLHLHRQRENEARAQKARENLERRVSQAAPNAKR